MSGPSDRIRGCLRDLSILDYNATRISDMPHRFKRSRRSRSHAPLCSSRCSLPSNTYLPRRQTTSPPMAQPTPRQMKSRVYTVYQADALQSSEVNKQAWRSEVEGKIVEMDIDIQLFLSYFMPSVAAMPPSQAVEPFHVPVGGKESDMYEPLVCVHA